MYQTLAKDLMLNALKGTAPATPITHVGAFQADAGKALTTPFGVASTDTFTCTAHGYANGDLVALSAITGGAGLRADTAASPDIKKRAGYFVIGQTANTFQLSNTPGGAAVDFTSDLTAGVVTRYIEIAGGAPAYARKAIAYNAAGGGTMDDSTNGAVIDVEAGDKVSALGQFSAVTAGTLLVFEVVAEEVFASQGTYTVTDSDLDLNAPGF